MQLNAGSSLKLLALIIQRPQTQMQVIRLHEFPLELQKASYDTLVPLQVGCCTIKSTVNQFVFRLLVFVIFKWILSKIHQNILVSYLCFYKSVIFEWLTKM